MHTAPLTLMLNVLAGTTAHKSLDAYESPFEKRKEKKKRFESVRGGRADATSLCRPSHWF